MRKVYGYFHSSSRLLTLLLLTFIFSTAASAGTRINGYVYDLQGNPLHQAMVSLATGADHKGADVITVFTDDQGRFTIAQEIGGLQDNEQQIVAQKLGYEQLRVTTAKKDQALELTVIMRSTPNYAGYAPASAWLAGLAAPKMEQLVNSCVGCHQVPAPEVRAYAKQIADVPGDAHMIRKESWTAMVKYMNYLSAEEFGRGASSAPPDANRVYAVGDGDEISSILYNHFTGPMQHLDKYDFGAPLAVTPDTVIMEYEVPRPNAIREALVGGSPPKLWAADVSSNRMYGIDIATGEQEILEVPTDLTVGPHTLHRGQDDGTIWIAPFFSSVIAQLDPVKKSWRTWPMKNQHGRPVGIHDLSFGYEHNLLTDSKGLIWFSDIGNNAVGYLDPKTGVIENYVAPEIPGRPGRGAALYGLVMTKDRKHIWYSQFGIGSFGSFDVETRKFEKSVQLPSIHSGPRRLSINDEDIMYVPLYGAGQLIEYDTRAGKQIGIYDLPDRASAPYAVTWDPKRRVVWIPTSNADVIYKFDPKDKSFSVLPLPRPRAFLRMLVVDPESGVLITSYANIVEHVHGPRMALLIDPGDKIYQSKTSPVSKLISARN